MNTFAAIDVLDMVDGMTVTLHEPDDVQYFEDFSSFIPLWMRRNRSLRLNIFDGVPMPEERYLSNWRVKSSIQWIENCPLPKNETFGRF